MDSEDVKKNIESELIDCYDGNLQKSECDKVMGWAISSEQNHKIARRVYSLLLALDLHHVKDTIDTEKAWNNVRRKKLDSNLVWWKWIQRVAAILFIPLMGFWIWQQVAMIDDMDSLSELLEIRTNPGMTTKITLPDGTLVCLNSNSILSYPIKFSETERCVRLSGEAYFEVAKDCERRFIVNTPGKSSIEVYGTKFNVEAYETQQAITTTLVEGKIGFFYNDGKIMKHIMMNSGQKIVYDMATNDIERYYTSGVSELSWKDGKIIFDDTPFDEVLRMLEKRFNVIFIVKNEKLYNNRFIGTFTTQQLERILRFFEISSCIHWKYVNDPDANQEKIQIEIF